MEKLKEEATQVVKSEKAVQVMNYFDTCQLESAQRVCKMFASSELVPDNYRTRADNPESKAVANCMIALELSSRLNLSPIMVMQNLYVVKGHPSWSSKFLIALVNGCGKYEPLEYKISNIGKIAWRNTEIDNLECIAYTSRIGSTNVIESSPVSIEMAIKEGWYSKITKTGVETSKWQTMPIKMLKYRAASFWCSENASELSMGIYTVEEQEDIAKEEVIDVNYEVLDSKPKVKKKIDFADKVHEEHKVHEEQSKVSESTGDKDEELGF